ncbi:MAG: hypothetical protein HY859_13095 [Caulobacterales bacterium]|nr:hypothetical protein [Caulobacterales bacterium]
MGKPWFHPKRYGYGAGLPCSWEGWLVLFAFMGVIAGVSYGFDDSHWRLRAATGLLAFVALVVIVVAKTRGGWRWRWGQGE